MKPKHQHLHHGTRIHATGAHARVHSVLKPPATSLLPALPFCQPHQSLINTPADCSPIVCVMLSSLAAPGTCGVAMMAFRVAQVLTFCAKQHKGTAPCTCAFLQPLPILCWQPGIHSRTFPMRLAANATPSVFIPRMQWNLGQFRRLSKLKLKCKTPVLHPPAKTASTDVPCFQPRILSTEPVLIPPTYRPSTCRPPSLLQLTCPLPMHPLDYNRVDALPPLSAVNVCVHSL